MRTFAKPNFEALANFAKEAEEREQKSSENGIRFSNLEVGSNEFIVCPPYNNRGLFVKKIFKHWNLGQEGKNSVECPELSDHADGSTNKKCPVCTAIRLVVQNDRLGFEDEKKAFGSIRAQGKTYVNAKILLLGGKKVEKDEEYSLPRIVRGPTKLADHIWQKLYEYKFQGMTEEDFEKDDYSDELVFSIKKIEKTVKGKPNTSYEYGMWPGKKPLVGTGDDLDEIVKNVYDLDIVFKNIWTLEKYASSVSYANLLLNKHEYASQDMAEWYDMCPPPAADEEGEEEKKEEPRKKIDTSKAKASVKKEEEPTPSPKGKRVVEDDDGETDSSILNERDVEGDDEKEEPSPTKGKTLKALGTLEKKSLVDQKVPKPNNPNGSPITRDPSVLGENNKPLCYETCDTELKVCKECHFLDTCLMKTMKKKMGKG